MPSSSDARFELCSLRPMSMEDRDMILAWRNSDHVRASSLATKAIDPVSHRQWFEKVLSDSRCLYRVFMFRERAVGLVYFADIDVVIRNCKWGFYLGELGLPRGLGTMMGVLALDMVFSSADIDTVVARVRLENRPSRALHRKLGFVEAMDTPESIQDTTFLEASVWTLGASAWALARRRLVLPAVRDNRS